MRTLLIIGTFEALFLILLIISKRERRVSDYFLGLIFLSLALSIGFTWLELFNAEAGYPFPWALNISWIFIFLHGPALWFYIKSLSIKGFRFRLVYLLHLVPFATFFVVQYIMFFSQEPSHRIQLVINNTFQEWTFYKISVIGIGVSTFSYFLWGMRQIRDYRKDLEHHFSRIDNKDLEWLRILIIVSLVVYAGNVGVFILDLFFDIAPYHVLMLVTYSFASIYILVLGYFGLRQGDIFINNSNGAGTSSGRIVRNSEDSTEKGNHLEVGLGKLSKLELGKVDGTDHEKQSFIIQLTKLMEEQKPFMDPEITLSKLAGMMHVSPEYLSQILNKQLQHSFFDYINQYRIEEFKIECLSSENAHLSIMGIAYNCGFNSKAAFYRAFRKYEMISPTEYMQRLRKK